MARSCYSHLQGLTCVAFAAWAETTQPLFDDCFANITNTAHLDSQRKLPRSLPLNKGGLGLPDLSELALTARLAALASIPEHAQATHYKTTCVNQEAMELATRIEDATGAPTQPIIGTVHQFPEGRSHKGLQQKLSNLFHLAHAKALRIALSDSHPIMQRGDSIQQQSYQELLLFTQVKHHGYRRHRFLIYYSPIWTCSLAFDEDLDYHYLYSNLNVDALDC